MLGEVKSFFNVIMNFVRDCINGNECFKMLSNIIRSLKICLFPSKPKIFFLNLRKKIHMYVIIY